MDRSQLPVLQQEDLHSPKLHTESCLRFAPLMHLVAHCSARSAALIHLIAHCSPGFVALMHLIAYCRSKYAELLVSVIIPCYPVLQSQCASQVHYSRPNPLHGHASCTCLIC